MPTSVVKVSLELAIETDTPENFINLTTGEVSPDYIADLFDMEEEATWASYGNDKLLSVNGKTREQIKQILHANVP